MGIAGWLGWIRRASLRLTGASSVVLLGLGSTYAAGSLTLAWDPPSTATDIAGYYLYYGTASRSYPNRVAVGAATTATISNLSEGQVYYFAATSYSASGLESDYSPETVFTNLAPAFTNTTVLPGSRFACVVTPPVNNGDHFTWSLEPGAPVGATINATNGIFSWRPGSDQASTIHTISVRITDQEQSALSTLVTLVIGVEDYLAVTLGSASLQAGESASVPLYFRSSAPITNIICSIGWPAMRLVNPSFSVTLPGMSLTSLQNQTTNLVLTLQMAPGQMLQGSNQLGWLSFQAVPNQTSGFLPLPVELVQATQTATGTHESGVNAGGEVAVIGDVALLKAGTVANSGRVLSLYGKVGARYQLQYSTSLGQQATWSPLLNYTQTGIVQNVSVDSTSSPIFYRVVQ